MKTTFYLSVMILLLAAFATTTGLFVPNLYQDNEYVTMLWKGNDWVTLLVILPALAVTLFFSKKENVKARLVWIGLLAYLFYNYAFYLFGTAFNAVFLVYVVIFSSSIFALIFGLSNLPVEQIITTRKSIRWLAVYLILIVIMLCMVELPSAIQYIFTGEVPELVTKVEHPTSIVHALDLSLVVPFSFLAALYLWEEKKWGVVLAAIMLIKGGTYGLVLVANSILLLVTEKGNDPLLPFYAFLVIGGLGGLWWLLNSVDIIDKENDDFFHHPN